jgi:hypothetical protein
LLPTQAIKVSGAGRQHSKTIKQMHIGVRCSIYNEEVPVTFPDSP